MGVRNWNGAGLRYNSRIEIFNRVAVLECSMAREAIVRFDAGKETIVEKMLVESVEFRQDNDNPFAIYLEGDSMPSCYAYAIDYTNSR